jgi:zona occludens toxin (predicted ATPase)
MSHIKPGKLTHVNLWLRKSSAPPRARAFKAGKTRQVIVEKPAAANEILKRLTMSDTTREIYKIDLLQVVSKYIGETEKNLRKVFGNAANKGSIIFFDEADALFGKHTDVRDSHDRYARQAGPVVKRLIKNYKGTVIIACKSCQ